MADNEHLDFKKEKGHDCISRSTENGACLGGHEGGYKKQSCAYRWQAHVISIDERTNVYDKRYRGLKKSARLEYKDGIESQAYKSKKGKMNPAGYTFMLNVPDDGDWDLKGPPANSKYKVGRKRVPANKNFTDWRWPYWHNAHHMISKSLFNNLISESGVAHIMRPALLKAKYNINHKINMIILPQDREVAKILNLPRHLVLKEVGRQPEYADHPMYTRKVRIKLEKIVNSYAKAVREANKGKPHGKVRPDLDKKKLEELSKSCYSTILNFGKLNGGAPLDDIPAIVSAPR